LDNALDEVEVVSLLDRGFRGLAKARAHWHAPVVTGAPKTSSPTGSEPTTASRPGCGHWSSRRSAILATPGRCAAGRGLLYRIRDVFRAVGALLCLCRWLHRITT
jgi:hypothetical protein